MGTWRLDVDIEMWLIRMINDNDWWLTLVMIFFGIACKGYKYVKQTMNEHVETWCNYAGM